MPDIQRIRNQMLFDRAIVVKLRELDDDAAKPHTLDHHFFSNREDGLKGLAQALKLFVFEVGEVQSKTVDNGSTKFWLDVKSKCSTLLPLLSRQSVLMLSLAEAFGCTYDGWGTFEIKKEAPPGSAD